MTGVNYQAETDAGLLALAPKDPDAFGIFCERHVLTLERWISRQISSPQDAAEITAETLAQAWRSVKRFSDDNQGSGVPWLYGIAKNLLRRYFRSQKIETRARTRLGMPLTVSLSESDAIESRVTADAYSEQLTTAIATLPSSQREALDLHVVQDLSYREVAMKLGCSEAAARVHVSRALRALANQIEETQ